MKKFKVFIFFVVLFVLLFSSCELEHIGVPDGLCEDKEKYLLQAFYEFAFLNGGGWVYWDEYKNVSLPVPLDDIFIEKYYGTFNGAIVVSINAINNTPRPEFINFPRVEILISGVSFFNLDHDFDIVAYKDGKFYSLQNAYNQGLLKVNDLRNIAYLFNKNIVFPARIPVCMDTVVLEQTIISNVSINDNFADNSIMIIIDKNFTHWRIYAKDFEPANIKLEMVVSLNLRSNKEFNASIYELILKNRGKQNVIGAINNIGELPFIRYAGPNFYYSLR